MNSLNEEKAASFSNEMWQAEVLGQIYETDFEELTQWIIEGALQPEDKVRRGNLRWLEAKRVPPLMPFFNARANGTAPPVVQVSTVNAEKKLSSPENIPPPMNFSNHSSGLENQIRQTNSGYRFENAFSGQAHENFPPPDQTVCVMHPDAEAKYLCDTCVNAFCKTCPSSYGGTVKICPMCGAMCRSAAETRAKKERASQYARAIGEGFGFSDFGKALAHPFKFKTSLFFGAVMFMFFTLGQSAASVGGLFMMASAILCAMMANMLTFGILANTVDNFTQGKLDANFMPNFDDFSLWDDVIHPFFLSIGAYLSSFGPLILIIAVSVYWMVSSVASQVNSVQEEAAKITYLQRDERKVAQQTEQVKKLLDNVKKSNPNSFESESFSGFEEENLSPAGMPAADETEEQVRQAEELINQTRQAQLESAIGKTPETEQQEFMAMAKNFLAMGAVFLLLAFLALLWGIFYFPAACAVAGYTRSFAATINPAVGLDTIRRLGFDYAKIWLMVLILAIFSGVVSVILSVVLLPFDMPRVGNLPATAIGSFFTFYFCVVFACILGFALYKASDRLNLYKG